jgi:hypothetical protein
MVFVQQLSPWTKPPLIEMSVFGKSTGAGYPSELLSLVRRQCAYHFPVLGNGSAGNIDVFLL